MAFFPPIMQTVMAFGTFDGLHEGHRYFLKEARKFGDSLIAVVAQDKTVEELKLKRPRHSLAERICAILDAGLADQAVPGDTMQGTWGVLRKYKPHIVALGHDQRELGAALVTVLHELPLHPKIKRISRMRPPDICAH